jgi:hypothetical protein
MLLYPLPDLLTVCLLLCFLGFYCAGWETTLQNVVDHLTQCVGPRVTGFSALIAHSCGRRAIAPKPGKTW